MRPARASFLLPQCLLSIKWLLSCPTQCGGFLCLDKGLLDSFPPSTATEEKIQLFLVKYALCYALEEPAAQVKPSFCTWLAKSTTLTQCDLALANWTCVVLLCCGIDTTELYSVEHKRVFLRCGQTFHLTCTPHMFIARVRDKEHFAEKRASSKPTFGLTPPKKPLRGTQKIGQVRDRDSQHHAQVWSTPRKGSLHCYRKAATQSTCWRRRWGPERDSRTLPYWGWLPMTSGRGSRPPGPCWEGPKSPSPSSSQKVATYSKFLLTRLQLCAERPLAEFLLSFLLWAAQLSDHYLTKSPSYPWYFPHAKLLQRLYYRFRTRPIEAGVSRGLEPGGFFSSSPLRRVRDPALVVVRGPDPGFHRLNPTAQGQRGPAAPRSAREGTRRRGETVQLRWLSRLLAYGAVTDFSKSAFLLITVSLLTIFKRPGLKTLFTLSKYLFPPFPYAEKTPKFVVGHAGCTVNCFSDERGGMPIITTTVNSY